MNDVQRTLLSIAARLLNYPDDTFGSDLQAIRDWTIRLEDTPLQRELMTVVESLAAVDVKQLRQRYVSTFDLKEATGLYLTAHELGDSRKRGNALILLQRMIIEAGFEWPENELADYIPMLYEFLAEVPEENHQYKRLERRLASATQYILDHIPKKNPYYGVFALLLCDVFDVPTEEEMRRLEEQREETDLGEMPYPIQFQ